MTPVFRDQDGQAAAELVAAAAALLVAGLVGWQLVLAGHTAWLSAHAARAGARADLVGADPLEAARSALPRSLERGLELERRARGGVDVRVPLPVVHRAWRARVKLAAGATLEVAR